MKLPVFLDRDGVINENRGDYVRDPSQWIPIPGAIQAAAELHYAGHPLVVITNQSGIGRGYYTETDVLGIHSVMEEAFRAAGAAIAGCYHCPHRPDEKCRCRKPETGMIDRARAELSLPPGGWMVGDAGSDMELGRRCGLRTVLVLTGRGASQLELIRARGMKMPDHVLPSLVSAGELILTP